MISLETALVAVLAVLVFLALENWLRVWEQRIPSPLIRTLYRAGVDSERLASPGVLRETALAEQRCPTCPAIGACREALESDSAQRYGFCPNAALVERLTGTRRA